MRTEEQIDERIEERKQLLGNSEELDGKVRNYIDALEWVKDGELEEVTRIKKAEFEPHFDELIFGGRTGEKRIYPHLKTDEAGVYLVFRIDQRELIDLS